MSGARPEHTGISITLDPPVPATLAEEVERRLLFVTPGITGYRLDTGADGDVCKVVLSADGPLDAGVVVLIGVGASEDALPDHGPAVLAAGIEAGLLCLADGGAAALSDVDLTPVRPL